MKRKTFVAAAVLCCVGMVPARADEAVAAAALERLGARIQRDGKLQTSPVVEVDLSGLKVQDSDLVHLREFRSLRVLNFSYTAITDAGLQHVRGLTSLQSLSFAETKVTDAGLAHLAGLGQLLKLAFPFNQGVTDRGLPQLHGLKRLESINLADTKVTAAGIAELQKALPKAYIIH